jgi:hypothetical protein
MYTNPWRVRIWSSLSEGESVERFLQVTISKLHSSRAQKVAHTHTCTQVLVALINWTRTSAGR